MRIIWKNNIFFFLDEWLVGCGLWPLVCRELWCDTLTNHAQFLLSNNLVGLIILKLGWVR